MGKENRYYPRNSFRVCIDELNTDIIGHIYSPIIDGAIVLRGFEH